MSKNDLAENITNEIVDELKLDPIEETDSIYSQVVNFIGKLLQLRRNQEDD